MALGRPSKIVTNARPVGNLFGPVNHFRFWGSTAIATAGLVGGYMYFKTTTAYVPFTASVLPKIWNYSSPTGTALFLLILCPFAVYSFIFYIGRPWKLKIYKNWLHFILIILNVISTVALHYITQWAKKPLSMATLDYSITSTLLLISILACLLGYFYNVFISEVLEECYAEKDE